MSDVILILILNSYTSCIMNSIIFLFFVFIAIIISSILCFSIIFFISLIIPMFFNGDTIFAFVFSVSTNPIILRFLYVFDLVNS